MVDVDCSMCEEGEVVAEGYCRWHVCNFHSTRGGRGERGKLFFI